MGDIRFVTGGARSGKSTFAEQLAVDNGGEVVYVATMEANDDELARRIARHRSRRPAHWQTIEAPIDVRGAIESAPPGATLLIDCLSLWVSNLLLSNEKQDFDKLSAVGQDEAIDACLLAARDVLDGQERRPGILIAVTNEVGASIVPANPLARAYRDALGLVNQTFARAAVEAHLLVSGLPLRLK